jgi:hypothetical protein
MTKVSYDCPRKKSAAERRILRKKCGDQPLLVGRLKSLFIRTSPLYSGRKTCQAIRLGTENTQRIIKKYKKSIEIFFMEKVKLHKKKNL